MKYLKKYNESSSYREIRENLIDICRELEDERFSIFVHGVSINIPGSSKQSKKIQISIDKYVPNSIGRNYLQEFEYSTIQETVMRIVDYMEIEGWKPSRLCKVYYLENKKPTYINPSLPHELSIVDIALEFELK